MADDSLESKLAAIPAEVLQKKIDIVDGLLLQSHKDIYRYCLILSVDPDAVTHEWSEETLSDKSNTTVIEQLKEQLRLDAILVQTKAKLEAGQNV